MHNKSIEFSKLKCIYFLLFLLFLLVSCATTQKLDLYDGPSLQDTKIAHLCGTKGPLYLLSVNDLYPPDGQKSYGTPRYDLRIPAGSNTLIVKLRMVHATDEFKIIHYQKFYSVYSPDDISIDFLSQPGHIYELSYEFNIAKLIWSPVIIDKTDNKKHTFPNSLLIKEFTHSNYQEKADRFTRNIINTYCPRKQK